MNHRQLFSQLKDFFMQFGHPHIPANDETYEKLYSWTIAIRKKRSLLTEEELTELTQMGFDWNIPGRQRQTWDVRYQQLKEFYQEFGHCRVPVNYDKVSELRHWTSSQRTERKRGKLSKKRIALLDEINFVWSNQITEEKEQHWDEMYQRLSAFYEKNGHSRVPNAWKEDLQLARWVHHLREKEAIVSDDKKEKLAKLDFHWYAQMKKYKASRWDEMYEALKVFKQAHGHCQVPRSYDNSLSIWVIRQRKFAERLSEAKKAKLDAIDFLWKEDLEELPKKKWMQMYKKLQIFKKIYGHSRVPKRYKADVQLATWVAYQRNYPNRLCDKRKALLDDLDFSWKEDIQASREAQWMEMYEQLVAFFKVQEHSQVPDIYPENPSLGRWVSTQRAQEKKLSDEKIQLLNDVKFVWRKDINKQKSVAWMHKYKELEEFFTRFGHSQVPEDWEENPNLAIWVYYQRNPKKPLSQRKINLLNKLNFKWKEDLQKEREDKWMNQYKKLLVFRRRFGHCMVPNGWEEDTKLARWVAKQRRVKDKLTNRRKQLLDKIGFMWSKQSLWEEKFQELKAFYDEQGHSQVPENWEVNKNLATWVAYQRKAKEKGLLSKKQVALLNGLNFMWKDDLAQKLEEQWMERFEELKAFKQEFGHCQVPSTYENTSLANWVFRQRKRENKLSTHRKKMLNEVGFVWKKDVVKGKAIIK